VTLALDIIFQNKNYIFINKPAGIHSTQLPKGGGSSLADLLIQSNPQAWEIAAKPEDAGLLNRLDFETSGVIVAAKSRAAWLAGRDLFKSEALKKTYLVIIEGDFKEPQYVENYLGTPNRGAKKIKVYKSKPAKAARALLAQTEFEPLGYDSARDCSLVRVVCPKAQRHQVRAHSAFLGFPLLGDELYGATRKFAAVYSGETRQFMLHAEKLQFVDPLSGDLLSVQAPLPAKYFQI
jgi:23S rRNA pseudouridine1911/1915/1917 synthase